MGIKPENYFMLKNGNVIKNLFELSKVLDKMPNDVFNHHVNKERNDFSSWIKEVIKDKDLAQSVMVANSRENMKKLIAKKIQKDAMKSMDKKTAVKIKTKSIKKKTISMPKIIKSQPVQRLKNRGQEIKNKLHNVLFSEEKRANTSHPYINPKKTNYGIKCPYKTIHCGVLEFLFGVGIGLLTAFVYFYRQLYKE